MCTVLATWSRGENEANSARKCLCAISVSGHRLQRRGVRINDSDSVLAT